LVKPGRAAPAVEQRARSNPSGGWGRIDEALVGLRVRPPLFLLSTFCFLPLPGVGLSGPFDVECWMFDVGCWMFGIHHKHPEYNVPLPPPSGWSGGTLVPPWTYPGTIDPPLTPLFDQARLFKSVSSGFSVAQPYLGLDVGSWMFAIRSWPSVAGPPEICVIFTHLPRVV
jgi:hypothetical protein